MFIYMYIPPRSFAEPVVPFRGTLGFWGTPAEKGWSMVLLRDNMTLNAVLPLDGSVCLHLSTCL
jgi:hypothetical protein